MDKVRSVFPHALRTFSEVGVGDGEYSLCLQGYRQPDSAFMLVVPVRYTSPESEDIIKDTSVKRRKAMEALANRLDGTTASPGRTRCAVTSSRCWAGARRGS